MNINRFVVSSCVLLCVSRCVDAVGRNGGEKGRSHGRAGRAEKKTLSRTFLFFFIPQRQMDRYVWDRYRRLILRNLRVIPWYLDIVILYQLHTQLSRYWVSTKSIVRSSSSFRL